MMSSSALRTRVRPLGQPRQLGEGFKINLSAVYREARPDPANLPLCAVSPGFVRCEDAVVPRLRT